jgi:histidinol-phosphate/aromatic aminotransferase/cobyric acid decarboxylase-like protein
LEHPAYYGQKYRETALLRADLAARLDELGLEVVPSAANFLLCHIPPGGPYAGTLIERCQRQGLFLRDVRSMGSQFRTDVFRIAVKDADTIKRSIEILKGQLASGIH